MSYKVQFENSIQQTNCYENLYENSLERELRKFHKSYPYSLKLIDVYPVYCFEEQKYICYRKILKEQEKLLIIQEHIKSPTYAWKENAYYNTISLYYFMSIKKNEEYRIPYTLETNIEGIYRFWDVWGVLEDGTILTPYETRKIMKLLQSSTIQFNINDDNNMEGLDEDEAREVYIDSLNEGNSDVW